MSTVTINRYLGSSLAEASVPPGAIVMELKYCEICGVQFVRPFAPTEVYETRHERYWSVAGYSDERPAELRKDHGRRFCDDCFARGLEPDVKSQERYKTGLPNAREERRNRVYSMPDYTKLNPDQHQGRRQQARSRRHV